MKKTNKNVRALIVENDPTFRSFWKRLFEEMEIKEVDIVADPLRAMKLLTKERYNLLISEVVIPHITGYELAKYARRKQPDIEILLTTGYATDLSRFDLEGCRFHLLHKPYGNLVQSGRFCPC